MPETTTIGQVLIQGAVPEDMRPYAREEFSKKQTNAFFKELATRHPEQYVETLQNLQQVGQLAATSHGGSASISLKDFKTPPGVAKYREGLRQQWRAIVQDPVLTSEEKNDQVVKLMQAALPGIAKMLQDEGLATGNVLALHVAKGIRGSPPQLTQLLFGDILSVDNRGKPLPVAGLHGYGGGVQPMEYWAGAYGARKGFWDVQYATARAGFLAKQMAQATQRLKITENDCGTAQGLPYDGDDHDNIGSVLARAVGDLPAGTVITKELLPRLKGKSVVVRSVSTCDTARGICKKCAGKRDQGSFPAMGDYIGITSARVMSEPLTQSGLRSKHLGGLATDDEDEMSALDEVNQFLQVPEAFVGGAVLAPRDGRVASVTKAPQGGAYVKVGDEQVYVPAHRQVGVKAGDEVTAGDLLSDGTPNPAEIAHHKGIGAGRRYFIRQLSDIMTRQGIPTHRRNVDTLARAFFDQVRVTNPAGLDNHEIGDVTSYAQLQKNWKPRPGTEELSAGDAVGRYLEQPMYYFTIGTRVTRPVVKELMDAGYNKVRVHRNPPGFEPEIARLMSRPGMDPDWKTRLAGFGLKSSLMNAATHGADSPRDNTSPVPLLMDPSRIDTEKG